jgi:hypothetical protein
MLVHWVHYVDPFGKEKSQLIFLLKGPYKALSDPLLSNLKSLTTHYLRDGGGPMSSLSFQIASEACSYSSLWS